MGYTRYWNRTEKKITQEFVDAVNEILTDCKDKGIKICNWNGIGAPEVNLNCVAFNGNRDRDLDHESFNMDNTETGFNFCKTARKPYDYAVRTVLRIAEEMGLVNDVSDDGENEEIISDAQFLGEDDAPKQMTRITFYNKDGRFDETEFDTRDEKELASLWWDFCKENKLIFPYEAEV